MKKTNKTKKAQIKVRDLKPKKDAKGGKEVLYYSIKIQGGGPGGR